MRRPLRFLALLWFAFAGLCAAAAEPDVFCLRFLLRGAADTTLAGGWRVDAIDPEHLIDETAPAKTEGTVDRLRVARQLRDGPAGPFPLAELPARLSALDPDREWLTADTPRAGPPTRVYVTYRLRATPYVIALQRAGAAPPPDGAPLLVPLGPGVQLALTDSRAAEPTVQQAAATAARTALRIAQENNAGPGSPAPTQQADSQLRRALATEFSLAGHRGAEDYGARTKDNRLVGLAVAPVFIPATILFELKAWKEFETGPSLQPAQVQRLKEKRAAAELAIQQVFAAAFPLDHPIVTQRLLDAWSEAPATRTFAPAFARMEGDRMVITVTQAPTILTLEAVAGVTYSSEERLQGTGRYAVTYDRLVHTTATLEGAYGTHAATAAARLALAPKLPVHGWKLATEVEGRYDRWSEAVFDGASPDQPVRWRKQSAALALTASRRVSAASAASAFDSLAGSAALGLRHDDHGLPATLATAGGSAAGGALVTAAAEIRADGPRAWPGLSATLRSELAHRWSERAGRTRYTRLESMLRLAHVHAPPVASSWLAELELRHGTTAGTSPVSDHFRAGGDGWLRGLQEGELAGASYVAASFSAGPDISALLGKRPGLPPAFLLAFVDTARVRERSDARAGRSAHSFGLAARLRQMPVSATLSADLTLGYAYAPDSRANRRGAFFVRFDLPLD